MRSGNRPRRSTAKYADEAAEVSADRNVSQSSQDGLDNHQPKRGKRVRHSVKGTSSIGKHGGEVDSKSSQDGMDNYSKRAKTIKHSDDGLSNIVKQCGGVDKQPINLNSENGAKDAIESANLDNEAAAENSLHTCAEEIKDEDECDWEEGLIQEPNSETDRQNGRVNAITVEFSMTPDLSNESKRKNIHRFTAKEKEAAELVHKVHLLCLIARGRIIDRACNDPLIQATLLSQLPPALLKISEATKLTVDVLGQLVTWFHKNFHVRNATTARKPFSSALSLALGAQEGSPEEVVALSVALFRALNISARFVSILDVASLKPEREKPESFAKDIFDSSTLMVAGSKQSVKCLKSPLSRGRRRCDSSVVDLSELKTANVSRETGADKLEVVDDVRMKDQSSVQARNHAEHPECSRRKGDLEFEMQLQMALSATEVAKPTSKSAVCVDASQAGSSDSSPSKRVKPDETSSSYWDISTAIGCEKVGAPLCWAEVFCGGNTTGRWVHVDVIHALINGEQRVEASVSACKKSLRYVVAFARNGAKDVTRRYCAEWYKISPKRVNATWWDSVLAPLRQLESGASGGMADPCKMEAEFSTNVDMAERASIEDMELETMALTEPLPTNQQAYRNHPLYAIEKWLTKYQIFYPKRPVLGFISGHAVYPRTCVQTLHTREKWLREALQVRASELPVKIVKSASKHSKGQNNEVEDPSEVGSDGNVSLYGKWQTEPLRLQPAVNGIVPKNERGQVDVWSEKCLPPGTVHLRLPRLVPIVERLGINFAPAMVGFEFRNGRSFPVYEGLVVCTEFKDTILEAYAEVEYRRQEVEKKRVERQALSRWYRLVSSIVTRERLNESYGRDTSQQTKPNPPKSENRLKSKVDSGGVSQNSPIEKGNLQETEMVGSTAALRREHEHAFANEDESVHEEEDGTLIRTKRCKCGFVVQVEEL